MLRSLTLVCSFCCSCFLQVRLHPSDMLPCPFLILCWRRVYKEKSMTEALWITFLKNDIISGLIPYWKNFGRTVLVCTSFKVFFLDQGIPRTPLKIVTELLFILLNTIKKDMQIMLKHFGRLRTTIESSNIWETHSGSFRK